ncbi:hypothetical protein [Phreatobacter stygius]|uniref:Uncharacterized protein n=1 Tax=Phreatobacter stygius TaxID=1940610 RepID=A0A4D7B2B5_9HYPH|nr:hypothetical protein [Phreatobacter stygius]QCI66971.1 hypothetical protein E8M01_23645 [Phreatobacter stygius]
MHVVDPYPITITSKLRQCRDVWRRHSGVIVAFAATCYVPPLVLALGLLAMSAGPLPAHDIYTHLKNKAGRSCCDGTDCRPVRYRQTPSGVHMLIEGVWVRIPDSQVEQRTIEGDTGETGGGHWCGRRLLGENRFMTYCAFVPPSATGITPPGPPVGSPRPPRNRMAHSGPKAH